VRGIRHYAATRPRRSDVAPPPGIHAVVAGGTSGWQITLIAAGAALLAAVVAVLLNRARAARRHKTAPSA
jgi:hypothetical protein